MPAKLSEEIQNLIAEAYATGESLRNIGRRYDCSAPTVRKVITAKGGTIRPRGRKKKL